MSERLHYKFAELALARHSNDEARLQDIMRSTGRDREDATRLLEQAKAALEARRARSQGFVFTFTDGMRRIGLAGSIFQVVLGVALLVACARVVWSSGGDSWTLGLVLGGVGVLSLVWGWSYFQHTRNNPLAKP